jgi:ATP-dependent Lon protease
MLPRELEGKGARNAKLALYVAIAASAAAGTSGFFYSGLSLELDSKSTIIAQQNQEIQQYQAELEQKNAQLQELNSQIASMDQALAEKTEQASTLGGQIEANEAELNALRDQAALLDAEITVLREKIQTSDELVSELSQKEEASKRVTISHYGLGVNEKDQGVVFPIEVEIIRLGTGSVSIDVSNVEYEPSFQSAVRIAAAAASEHTGVSLTDKDIIVKFASSSYPQAAGDLVKVDGSSAGALISGMIAAGLSGTDIDSSVLVTGSILEDGTIGEIGGLEEKAEAASVFGVDTMLVPKSQEFNSEDLVVIGVSDIDEMMRYLAKS